MQRFVFRSLFRYKKTIEYKGVKILMPLKANFQKQIKNKQKNPARSEVFNI